MTRTDSIYGSALDSVIDHAIKQLVEWYQQHRPAAGAEALDYIEKLAFRVPNELSADDLVRIARAHRLPPAGIRDYIIHRVQTELVWVYYHHDLHRLST